MSELDRFDTNHSVYILAMLSLLGSLILLCFSLYILPFLLWELHYDIPIFLFKLQDFLENQAGFVHPMAIFIVFMLFFLPGLLLGIFAAIAAKKLDAPLLWEEGTAAASLAANPNRNWGESFLLTGKIFLLAILVILFLLVLQWLISVP